MSTAELTIQPVRPTTYNSYSRERKAEVLALVKANGGNVLRTADETGIPEPTICYWMRNAERFSEFQEQSETELAVKLDASVHKLINSIYDHDLDSAPLNHKSTAFGIVFDKLQLLRGQPTSITENAIGDSLTAIKVLAKNVNNQDITDEQAQELLDRSFKRLAP